MHILESIVFLQMAVFSKQHLYGQILVELEENENDYKFLLSECLCYIITRNLLKPVSEFYSYSNFLPIQQGFDHKVPF